MTSETWEEEQENAIAIGADGYTEAGSTIDEVGRSHTGTDLGADTGQSVDGGVPLESLKAFSISSQPTRRRHLQLEEDGNLGAGAWVEDASTNDAEDNDDVSTSNAPSSAAGYSGWDFPALRAEASLPTTTNGTGSKGKNWAKIKVYFDSNCTSM